MKFRHLNHIRIVQGFLLFGSLGTSLVFGHEDNDLESEDSGRVDMQRSSSGGGADDPRPREFGQLDPSDLKMVQAICDYDSISKSSPGTPKNKTSTNNTATKDANSKSDLACILLTKFLANLRQGQQKKAQNDDTRYIPDNYNKYEAPQAVLVNVYKNGTKEVVSKPVECGVFLNIRDISDFDESSELLTLDLDIILLWTDNNILKAYQNASPKEKAGFSEDPVVLSPTILKKLWMPDIYFEEVISLSQPTLMGNSVTVVLSPQTGVVVYRARALTKLSCNMDFKYYPADTQSCSFTLKSFSYTTKYLELSWILQGDTGVYLHGISDPNFDYQISSFTTNDTYLDLGPASDNSSLYTNLQFTLLARRKMTYHLVQTYFASVFFVVVTWLCFLISADLFEVRVGIAMSTLLTLTAMFAAVRESAPNVSYVKAIDIWMVSCIMFIFFALAGFTTTAWIKRGLKRLSGPSGDDEATLDELRGKPRKEFDAKEKKRLLRKYHIATILTEQFAVHILSISYLVFNMLYWSWLLTESGYFNWSVNSTLNSV